MSMTELTQLIQQATIARNNQDYERALQLYQTVLDQSDVKTADSVSKPLRFVAWQQSGRLHFYLGNPNQALQCYQKAYDEAETDQQKVDALVLMGDVQKDGGDYEEAMTTQQRALHLAESVNYPLGQAGALRGIGTINYDVGHLAQALSYLKKSHTLFVQLQQVEGQARTKNAMGVAYADLGQIDKAIFSFQDALKLRQYLEGRITALILNNLGECYQSLFDMQQALLYHRQAWALAERLRLPYLQADLARNLGVDLCEIGRFEDGIEYLYRALAVAEDSAQQDVTLQTLYSLAMAELKWGQPEQACNHAHMLQKEAEQHKTRSHRAKAYQVLGLCAQRKGDMALAEQWWQQALFLAHETHQQNIIWQLHASLAQIATNPVLVQTHNRIAKEVIEQIIYPVEDDDLRQKFLKAAPVRTVLAQL